MFIEIGEFLNLRLKQMGIQHLFLVYLVILTSHI